MTELEMLCETREKLGRMKLARQCVAYMLALEQEGVPHRHILSGLRKLLFQEIDETQPHQEKVA